MTTYSAILDIPRDTVAYLASLLHQHQRAVGTRTGRRALSVGKQAVLVLRWFLDNTRLSQLRRDNGIGKSTAYSYLHEGINVLAAQAPTCIPRWKQPNRRATPTSTSTAP